jgi:hypothetical protein
MRMRTWAGRAAGCLLMLGCTNEAAPTREPVGGEKTPPTVSISAPAAGTVAGQVTIAVSAADASGIRQVQWKINGALLPTVDSTAPFEYAWNTALNGPGTYVWQALATDSAGNSAESALVTYMVSP